jgi:SulP family sulfate permease
VILSPISHRFGIGGLALATLWPAAPVRDGRAALGRMIEFVPYPVTTGFTRGIAVVIATLQLKDLLGLEIAHMPEHFVERVQAIALARRRARCPTCDRRCDAGRARALAAHRPRIPRRSRRSPSATAAAALARARPGFEAATIASRFEYVADGRCGRHPRLPPLPLLPWTLPARRPPDRALARARCASYCRRLRDRAARGDRVAALGGGRRRHDRAEHDPDAELWRRASATSSRRSSAASRPPAPSRAPPPTSAPARARRSRRRARARRARAVVLLAPLLGRLPMASLAALLLFVAWNMAELDHFAHVLKVRAAPTSPCCSPASCSR